MAKVNKDGKSVAYTDGAINHAIDAGVDAVSNTIVHRGIRNVASAGSDILGGVSHGYKLVMNAAGIARTILRGGVNSADKDDKGSADSVLGQFSLEGDSRMADSNAAFDRYDSGLDFFFKCGDYFMPLTFNFSVEGSKRLVDSELIDGPTIIERVSKAPKVVDVNFRIERYTPRYTNEPDVMHVADQYKLIVNDFSAMMRDLYDNQDVFVVSNPYLNIDLAIQHVIMESFSVIPGVGTTILDLRMKLREVDMTANIIFDENASVSEGFNIRE